jgi:uncharacterized protein (TIGR02646 family)
MAAAFRHRAPVLNPIVSLTAEEHAQIKQLALDGALDWSTTDGPYAGLVSRFRAEVKEHYYRHQRRRCCYCSVELHDHKLSYDAEHILDKSDYTEYMFEPANLAAACKLCNGHKSNKCVSANGHRFTVLSKDKDDYAIVHPHLDEWNHHLKFDVVGRIIPAAGSEKGLETIRICGIASLNAARLADEFAIAEGKAAEAALRTFHEVSDVARKQELLTLLRDMASRFDHAGSRAVIKALEQDLDQKESLPALAPSLANVDVDEFGHLSIQGTLLDATGALVTGALAAPIALLPPPGGGASVTADKNPE